MEPALPPIYTYTDLGCWDLKPPKNWTKIKPFFSSELPSPQYQWVGGLIFNLIFIDVIYINNICEYSILKYMQCIRPMKTGCLTAHSKRSGEIKLILSWPNNNGKSLQMIGKRLDFL